MKTRNGLFGALGALAALTLAVAAFTAPAGADESTEPKAVVGQKAPDFTLTDAMGKEHTLSSYTGKGQIVVLEWFNSGCPYVVRHHEKYTTMTDLAGKYQGKVTWLAINSGAPGQQGYGQDKEAIEKWRLNYPVLIDADGQIGRLFGAKTTPHMFIIDKSGVLAYAGGIDNDPADKKSTGEKVNFVAKALDEILAGKSVSEPETQSYGCSVKYAQ